MKTKILYLLLAVMVAILACNSQSNAQERAHKVTEVDEMPEYPGKNKALLKDLKLIARYPEEALKKDLTGKVYVGFTVTKSGKIQHTHIARGVGPILDKEALQAVNKLDKIWKPGVKDGKAVDVSILILFEFKEDAKIEVTVAEPKK